jgi:cysteinyl-tRNA synthetase
MLQINSEKMSKSLGNFLLLRDVLKTTEPAVLRMLMLQTHYRSPLDFSDTRLKESGAALERLENFVSNTLWRAKNPLDAGQAGAASADATDAGLGQAGAPQAEAGKASVPQVGAGKASVPQAEAVAPRIQQLVASLKESFAESMDDDFNTAGALGSIFNFVGEVNTLLDGAEVFASDAPALEEAANAVVELVDVLGISLTVASEESTVDNVLGNAENAAEVLALAEKLAGFVPGAQDAEAVKAAMAALLDARANARAAKDYALADAIRDGLLESGFRIEDTPQGARIIEA